MGRVRDFDQMVPDESLRSLTTEITTLNHRVQQLTREHRTLQERLEGARSNRTARATARRCISRSSCCGRMMDGSGSSGRSRAETRALAEIGFAAQDARCSGTSPLPS
ncbi:hypothetical protein GCM10010430_50430 [Kitasatospora cystarginea]|uniref:Uncharacterized protein n=1 Tax=Kitasatospora cystarginea TaxID=58350 RepID=A0ABN3EK15_9ACTN